MHARCNPKQELANYACVVGATLMSKVALLEAQFQHAGIQIIGVQEGRSRNEQVRQGTFFNMYCAAADARGCYGTQLWASYGLEFRADAWEAPRSRIVVAAAALTARRMNH